MSKEQARDKYGVPTKPEATPQELRRMLRAWGVSLDHPSDAAAIHLIVNSSIPDWSGFIEYSEIEIYWGPRRERDTFEPYWVCTIPNWKALAHRTPSTLGTATMTQLAVAISIADNTSINLRHVLAATPPESADVMAEAFKIATGTLPIPKP